MKKPILFIALIIGVASFAIAAKPSTHPVEMGGNDCVYCHAPDSTAENKSESVAYAQWVESRHGVNNVKCHTCHGDESSFMPQSDINICLSCHPQQVSVIKRRVNADTIVCAACHAPHSFPVKAEAKFVHK